MIKCVLFDMDGLMLDTEPIAVRAKVEEGKRIGLPITAEMVKHTIGMSQRFVNEYFQSFFGDKYNHDHFRKNRHKYIIEYMDKNGLPLKKGLLELLDFLNKNDISVAIVTSSSRELIKQYMKYGDLFNKFSHIVTSDDVKEGKPSPDVYLYAASLFNVVPKDCLVLEDSKNGVISGSKAGMKVIMIPDLILPDEEIALYHPLILDNLLEVIDVIKKENNI